MYFIYWLVLLVSFPPMLECCWKSGLCMGHQLRVVAFGGSETGNVNVWANRCRQMCIDMDQCEWFSYSSTSNVCHLNKACYNVVFDQNAHYWYAQRTCPLKAFSKLLVGAGSGGNFLTDVEVLDLSSPNSTCDQLQNLPMALVNSVGGLFEDRWPIICSGTNGDETVDNCFIFKDGSWKPGPTLNFARKRARGTCIPGKGLLVTGGYSSDLQNRITSTEFLQWDNQNNDDSLQWKLSVSLPKALDHHCIVAINESTFFITGGRQNTTTITSDTFFVHIDKNLTEPGPSLRVKRAEHSCGIFRDPHTQKFTLLVAGGLDLYDYGVTLDSVELLPQDSTEWSFGPKLPYPLQDAPAVMDQTGALLLVAGFSHTYTDSILKLANPHSSWTVLPDTKLKKARDSHVAILVPDHMVNCH